MTLEEYDISMAEIWHDGLRKTAINVKQDSQTLASLHIQ
jgi:hypothetical protein